MQFVVFSQFPLCPPLLTPPSILQLSNCYLGSHFFFSGCFFKRPDIFQRGLYFAGLKQPHKSNPVTASVAPLIIQYEVAELWLFPAFKGHPHRRSFNAMKWVTCCWSSNMFHVYRDRRVVSAQCWVCFCLGSWWKHDERSLAGRGRRPVLSEKQPGSGHCIFCYPLPHSGNQRHTLPSEYLASSPAPIQEVAEALICLQNRIT